MNKMIFNENLFFKRIVTKIDEEIHKALVLDTGVSSFNANHVVAEDDRERVHYI